MTLLNFDNLLRLCQITAVPENGYANGPLFDIKKVTETRSSASPNESRSATPVSESSGLPIEDAVELPTKGVSMSQVIDEIFQLLAPEEDEEKDFCPTLYAARHALTLLSDPDLQIVEQLPETIVFPTGEQGLRLHWHKNEREVRLLIPSQESLPTFIYFEEGEFYDMCKLQNASDLAEHLQWLTSPQ